MTETLEARIIRHEGLRLKLYFDSLGYPSIGVGRNLKANGLSEDEAMYLFRNDLEVARGAVAASLPWSNKLDDVRRGVLVEMCFQLGIARLLAFKLTLAALQKGDWATAAAEMKRSAWHIQTPQRCEELAEIVRTGIA